MRVACNRCQAKFEVPEERLAAGAIKVRCSQCGNTFVVRRRSRREQPAEPSQANPSPLADAAEPGQDTAEASFDDFDFNSFGDAESPATGAGSADTAAPAAEEPPPPTGELDLGGFDGLDDDLSGIEDLDLGSLEEDLPSDLPVPEPEEPLERVREEELVSARGAAKEVPVQGLADDMPRLDIQRGPRRSEAVAKSPVIASDRRRSPLLWLVVLAVLGTAGFTGYLFYTERDAAFTFLDPARISKLWQRRATEARFAAVDLQGYFKDLPADRRVFVIQGNVVNRAASRQSLIKVRGELFGPDGHALDSREVFCGNVLSENELATLPLDTIEARLQNEVGEGLRNVDIAPQGKVPFMVVFPTPPAEVAKFNVTVTAAQTGSGS